MIKVVSKRPVLLFILVMSITEAMATLVYNQTELNAAIKTAKPGDSILLSSTVSWKNTVIAFTANGTKENPIVVSGYPNAVELSGNSSITLAGEYLVVSKLNFENGFAKDRAVIEFKNKDALANNCRVTNCRITNFSKAGRFDIDSWIIFWGKNNRFDHNYIGDKLNAGTTLIVELNDERSQRNYHSIDSNYFAGRSRLGSNGGETIRIGVSRYSMTSSNTIIKDNLFYHNSGEVEIISVKSCNNQILYNTFYECEGNVVLRHGQGTTIANNIFIGNNKPYTGGVRVIDSGHTVKNNLFVGLAGNRFRSALAVMNAVPNSLPNRYLQVKDANISGNVFLNCANIIFGSGKDVERTLAPKQVRFTNNCIINSKPISLVDNNQDGGIQIQGNYSNNPIQTTKGFVNLTTKAFTADIASQENLEQLKKYLASNCTKQIQLNEFHWPTIPQETTQIGSTNEVIVTDAASLTKALASNNSFDVILLAAGTYSFTKELMITKSTNISTKGNVFFANGSSKSLAAFFIIGENGSLNIDGITFEANTKDAGDVQAAISTPKEGLLHHYKLNVSNCIFQNFNEGGYNAIRGTKNAYADYININNCTFKNNAGVCIDFGAEKDDKGIYGVEELIIENCVFTNNLGPAINVYRGGNDESTTGPSITINHCVFNEVDNREQSYVVRLLGAQYARVTNCIFNNSGAGGRSVWFEEYSWDDIKVDNCNFYRSGRVQSFHGKALSKQVYAVKPQFVNIQAGNFKLAQTPMLQGKGNDRKDIGLTR
jgi:poly(beta-D-mannuronate) lyase